MVTRLIVDGKLAPFYRGIEDWEDSYEDEDIAGVLQQVREKDYAEGVGNSVTEAMKLERDGGNGMGSVAKRIGMHRSRLMRMEEEKEERERRERKAYVGAMECPICFLVSLLSLLSVRDADRHVELSAQYQHVPMLSATSLHRVLCPDQAVRGHCHSSRI